MNQVPVLSNQLNLPFTLDEMGGMNAVYIDQAPMFGLVSAVYTPYGLKEMERNLIKEVQSFQGDVRPRKGKEEAMEELKWAILDNPHLHFVIKQNLVSNLKRIAGEQNNG